MGNSQENKQERQDHIKEFTIIVNAEPKVVAGKEISFEALVALAFPSAPKEQYPFYKITYHKAEGNKEGTLRPGQIVKLKERMEFLVSNTNQS